MKKLINFFIFFGILTTLASCAIGSATAGYAIKAQTASGLTAEAETQVVERAKREIYNEMNLSNYDAKISGEL